MSRITYVPQQTDLASTPSTPDTGFSRLYRKSDGDWYELDDAGNESFVFSANAAILTSSGVSTQATTAFVNKINGSTPNLPAGLYRCEVSYGWNCDNGAQDFISDLLVDGTAVELNFPAYHRQEPQDTAGAVGASAGTGTDQAHSFTRVDFLTLAAGVHTVQLRWRCSAASTTAIWSAKVYLKRVG